MPKQLATRLDDLEAIAMPAWWQGSADAWHRLPMSERRFLSGHGGSLDQMRALIAVLPQETRKALYERLTGRDARQTV